MVFRMAGQLSVHHGGERKRKKDLGVKNVDVAEELRTDGGRKSQENGCQLMHRWICLYRRGEGEREYEERG